MMLKSHLAHTYCRLFYELELFMNALTEEQYLNQEILDIDRWAGVVNGRPVLLDPATGEPMNGRMPEWVEADDRLKIGREHLGEIAAGHNLKLILSAHGSRWDAGWSRRLEHHIDEAGVTAFENIGWDRTQHAIEMGWARHNRHYKPPKGEKRSLNTRVLSAAAKSNKPTFSYDPEYQTDVPLDALLVEIIANATTRIREVNHLDRRLLQLGAQAMREWYIPGKYGYELQINAVPDDASAALIIGNGHSDLGRKFGEHGVMPQLVRLGHKDKFIFPKVMQTGVIPKSLYYLGFGSL
jgi:hypothetical protein